MCVCVCWPQDKVGPKHQVSTGQEEKYFCSPQMWEIHWLQQHVTITLRARRKGEKVLQPGHLWSLKIKSGGCLWLWTARQAEECGSLAGRLSTSAASTSTNPASMFMFAVITSRIDTSAARRKTQSNTVFISETLIL